MDELRDDVIAKIQGNEIKQVQIHGVVGKAHGWNFIDSSMLDVEFGYGQVMG
jgi:hypothetical protein